MANNNLIASESMAGVLGSNWTAITGLSKCQVTGGVSEPNALSVEAGQIYTGSVWTNDHISEATVTVTAEATTNFQLHVRIQSGAYSGYKAAIGYTTGTIYRIDAGTATQLATGPSSAFAAGDVWQLAVAGSVIILYQNGKRIAYAADDTYTNGSPGFSQFSSTDITHTKGLSWRGYGMLQQDGIWTKQGVILPLAAADIASSGFGRWNVSNILFEGNAQLLSGTVFKMWFMSGGNAAGNQGQSRYAESTDGISWTVRSSPVISNFGIQSLVKVGATYYAYGQAGTVQGTGNVSVYTSTDGINWSLQNNNFLSLGTAGQWDSANIYIQCNPVIIAGTWYFLYGGVKSGDNPVVFRSGIATSPDGITTVSKSGLNPVIQNSVSGPIVQVGNTYYTWTAAGPGVNEYRFTTGFNSSFNPAETVRYSSTDMLHWSATGVHSLHCTQLYESVNMPFGNATSCILIDVGGRCYNYYVGGPSDSAAPQYYQISLAIGPTSTANIVTQNEDEIAQTTSDAFTSGIGDLPAANWATPVGGTKLTIVSGNKVRATSAGAYNVMYNLVPSKADQSSQITLATLADSNSFLVVGVRIQSGSNSGYVAQVVGGTGTLTAAGANLLKMTNGATTTLITATNCRPAAGDVFSLTVNTVNGLPVLTLYQNGQLLMQCVDLANTYPTGQPGMGIFTSVLANTEFSGFAAGNAGVLPAYPGGGGGFSGVGAGKGFKFKFR
jgi:hypothetical protein